MYIVKNCPNQSNLFFQMKEKILVTFDFDHTLIDDNSDLYVRKLAPNGKIPQEIKNLYSKHGWIEYMGAIFEYLKQNGTTKDDFMECMAEIPFIEGNAELLKRLAGDQYEVIIISDSNSVFIDAILKASKLEHTVTKVYTNPASFSAAGCLMVQYYHHQDWCDLSTVNLCKGHILDEHIAMQATHNIRYPCVVYVGDGINDLCPCLRLRPTDIVFPRAGYKLIEQILKLPKGKMRAKVVPWKTGYDILNELQKIQISVE